MKDITTFFEFICKYQIQISIIQRDYAQGRSDKATEKIRNNLLKDIHDTLDNGSRLDFDFVYGTVVKDCMFQPIDGQQRLTTLWLLHWYIANRAGKLNKEVTIQHSTTQENSISIDGLSNKKEYINPTSKVNFKLSEILKKFSYQTRASSKRFCEKLIDFEITDNESISRSIKNQIWFIESWNLDPTVQSMLTMIDSIHQKFSTLHIHNIHNFFENLFFKEKIVFHVLYMENFDLEDELYIKMNSRGKPLTEFENFKAEFIESLPDEKRDDITQKLDGAWLDFFWNEVRNDPQKAEEAMYNYFKFVSELEFGGCKEDKVTTEYSKLLNNDDKFSFLVQSLDVLSGKAEENNKFSISDYIEKHICKERIAENYTKANDIILPIYEDIRIFQNLIDGERVTDYQKNILFTLLLQLIEKKESREELRHIRNICLQANLSNIQEYIYNIMKNKGGLLNKITERKSHSPFVAHEIRKLKLLNYNPKVAKEDLYYLEDHDFLRGKLYLFEENDFSFSTLITEQLEKTLSTFNLIFKEEDKKSEKAYTKDDYYNTIFRAMLCYGYYGINLGSQWSGDAEYYWYLLANSYNSWRETFKSLTYSNIQDLAFAIKNLFNKHMDKLLDINLIKTKEDITKCFEEIINAKMINLLTKNKDGGTLYYLIKYPTMNLGWRGTKQAYKNNLYYQIVVYNAEKHNLNRKGKWLDPYHCTIISKLYEPDSKEKSEVSNCAYLQINENKITIKSNCRDTYRSPLYIGEKFTLEAENDISWNWKIKIVDENNQTTWQEIVNKLKLESVARIKPEDSPLEAIIEVADNEDRIERAVAVISKLLPECMDFR